MLDEPFPSINVSNWEIDKDEPSGAEEKVWLLEPDTGTAWLFKAVTIKNGHVHGEDWAEKVTTHLAQALGVPCARVEMAEHSGRHGTISANLCPESFDMQPGQLFLQVREVPGYLSGNVPGRPGHSLRNIASVLDGALPPPGCGLPFEATAFDVFAGYVLLDAWVANRDRHDQNWSVLRPATGNGQLHLCGSYDHSNSLGYNVPEEVRNRVLSKPGGVGKWCEKGTAHRFEHQPGGPIPTLVEIAVQALHLASPAARAHWRSKLEEVEEDHSRRVLARTRKMSQAARSFALSILEVNRKRVFDAWP